MYRNSLDQQRVHSSRLKKSGAMLPLQTGFPENDMPSTQTSGCDGINKLFKLMRKDKSMLISTRHTSLRNPRKKAHLVNNYFSIPQTKTMEIISILLFVIKSHLSKYRH